MSVLRIMRRRCNDMYELRITCALTTIFYARILFHVCIFKSIYVHTLCYCALCNICSCAYGISKLTIFHLSLSRDPENFPGSI